MTTAQRSIVLIGFMGSGKSSVGRLLARQLGWPQCDTDQMVAAELGRPILAIFVELGEERFREAEGEILRNLDATKPAIIVTGGGIVLRSENVARLRDLGTVVWLKADLADLQERLARSKNRPLLQTPDPAATIAKLFAQREKSYEAAADFAVDTSKLDERAVAEAICDGIQFTG